jgi:hypothetical protein
VTEPIARVPPPSAPTFEQVLKRHRAPSDCVTNEDETDGRPVGSFVYGGGGGSFEEGERGARVVEEVAQLVRGEAEVDGHSDAAEFLKRPVRDDVLEPVAQRQQYAVPPDDAESMEPHGRGARTRPARRR